MVKSKASQESGWHQEALHARLRREEENAAMVQLVALVEALVKKEIEAPLVALAFHHVAMDHGSFAGKKTLKLALKSSTEELSKVAPAIFPPDRVVHLATTRQSPEAKEDRHPTQGRLLSGVR